MRYDLHGLILLCESKGKERKGKERKGNEVVSLSWFSCSSRVCAPSDEITLSAIEFHLNHMRYCAPICMGLFYFAKGKGRKLCRYPVSRARLEFVS